MPSEADLKHVDVANIPVQFFRDDETGETNITYYMPRKETCFAETAEDESEVPAICKEAALMLRSLATQIELFGEGKIDCVYYPLIGDEALAKEISETEKARAAKEPRNGTV